MNKKLLTMLGLGLTFGGLASFTPIEAQAQSNTVPVYLNAAVTPIDITVTEQLTFNLPSNSINAGTDTLTVTNNSNVGVIEVRNVAVNDSQAFTQVARTHDFARQAANSRMFSHEITTMTHSEAATSSINHDLNTDFTTTLAVHPAGGQASMTIAAQASPVTTSLTNEALSDIVVTVGFR